MAARSTAATRANTTYTTSPLTAQNDGYIDYCAITTASGTAPSTPFTLRVAEAIALPQTGDGSHPGLWLLLMVASLCGGVTLAVRARRRQER